MAIRYYDDVIAAKLKRWIPDNSNLRILKPDETKRLFELIADDNKDKAFKLPFIALSRKPDIEIVRNTKSVQTFDGLRLYASPDLAETVQMNVLPIKVEYQLDIYTKTLEEGDEYVRNFLFKLINNPTIKIEVPYNDTHIEHIANLRVLNTVSDTSAIAERIFPGQFTRWTIQMELQDGFLFSIPYKKNWRLYINADETLPEDLDSMLEVSEKITEEGELEPLGFNLQKR